MGYDTAQGEKSLEEHARATIGVGGDNPLIAPESLLPPEDPFNQTMLDGEGALAKAPVEIPVELAFDSRILETMSGRTNTVLPRLEADGDTPRLVPKEQERYGELKGLGEGGAGEVVLVHDRDITRNVAMKRLKHQDKALQVMRFIDEVQTVGSLEHPNIVPIHDVGLDEKGQYYFTMKYVEGETLSHIIEQLKAGNAEYLQKYSFEHRSRLFVEILHAIRFAHERGYIHRDIKPDNIMVGAYGEVQVMDWGIAKKIRETQVHEESREFESVLSELQETLYEVMDTDRGFQTEHGAIVGTPMYMSPEQVLGAKEEIDERSDIYSLSVMFYEFLTLQHYLEDKKTLRDVLFGVLQDSPIDPERLKNPHQGPVPRELSFFLRKGLGKKPEQRFGSVKEMLEELEANLEGRICVYCPSTFLKRGAHDYGRYLDNHRVLGVVWVCLLAIFVGVGIYAIVKELLAYFG
jgi:serine/threonine-protein kinase